MGQPAYRAAATASQFLGAIDVIRTAIDVGNCDKVIVADENVRYDGRAVDRVCALLVYWALLQTLRGSSAEAAHASFADRAAGAEVASGER